MEPILKRPFGATGHTSSVALFGAAALGRVTQADADRTLEVLLHYGVNHIDTAASYDDSELRIGPWMKRYRDGFFLATKTGARTYAAAKESIHRSLERLQVETIDLLQLHCLVHPDEWDTALGPGGALEACVEARDHGLIRFLGVTGHGRTAAAMHRRSLARFPFDSVLLPYNYTVMQDPEYAQDFEALVTECAARNVAVQTIKSIALGPWATQPRSRATWYQPLEQQPEIDRAVHWVLGDARLFLNTAGDTGLLPRVLAAAASYRQRPTDDAMRALAEATRMSTLFV